MIYKKLTLVFLVIIFLLLFSSFSFAGYTVEYDGENIELPELPVNDGKVTGTMLHDLPWIITYNKYLKTFSFFIPRKKIDGAVLTYEVEPSAVNNHLFYKVPGTSTYGQFYGYNLKDGNWVYDSGIVDYLDYSVIEPLLSSDDIYQNDGEDTFFQAPPLSILATIVEEAETEETLLQIVKILPLILVMVVCFLGLRKGLKTLSTLLQMA